MNKTTLGHWSRLSSKPGSSPPRCPEASSQQDRQVCQREQVKGFSFTEKWTRTKHFFFWKRRDWVGSKSWLSRHHKNWILLLKMTQKGKKWAKTPQILRDWRKSSNLCHQYFKNRCLTVVLFFPVTFYIQSISIYCNFCWLFSHSHHIVTSALSKTLKKNHHAPFNSFVGL